MSAIGAADVDGRVEQVRGGVVEGWAWRPAAAGDRVTLRVLIDGEEAGTAIAELPRPTLVAAGIGDGAHGFRFALPDRFAAPGNHRLCVAAESERLRPAASFVVTSAEDEEAPSAWMGVSFTVDHDEQPATEESPAVVPALDGRVEQVRDGVVEGWAWRPAAAGERVGLRVLLDGEEAGLTMAELERPTLAQAGIGDGAHGFSFTLPDELAHPGRRTLQVEADEGPLPAATGFRFETTRSDSPWYGARFSLEVPEPPAPAGAELTSATPGAKRSPTAPGAGASASPRPLPVVGRDGWLFDGEVTGWLLASDALTRIEGRAAEVLDALGTLDSRLSDLGVKLLPVLVPLKEHVCRDQLPDVLRRSELPRPGDLVARALLDHPRLEALDLLPALQAAAEERPTYAPTMPTISDWGFYWSYRALIKRIAALVAGVPAPLDLDESAILAAPSKHPRGSVSVTTEEGVFTCSAESLPEPPPEPVVMVPSQGVEATPPEHLARLGAEHSAGWEQPERRLLPRCMIVGTHAHTILAEWLGHHFRFTLLVGAESPLVDLVSLERPDVVAYMVEERSLLTS